MGLYKLCKHRGTARNKCKDAWWGSFQYKGKLQRASLGRWADQNVETKAQADAVFGRMKEAIRAGHFQPREQESDLTFGAFADTYVQRYVLLRGLRSRKDIELRLEILKDRWKGRRLADIAVGEIEDLIQDLKAKGRKPATVNRYLALLRHMMNWAVGREYVNRTPFRRGSQALISFEREDNRRIRRVSADEEQRLLAAANPVAHMMIIAALDTGMRRGELLTLRFGDVDFDQQVLHLRAENAKSKRGRIVPIGTTRLRTLLDWLRIGPDGEEKAAEAFVFTRGDDEAVKSFRTAWERARAAVKLRDVRFHDLRSEYASRLVEKGVPLSQVRDLLGHSTIAVTERYDRQVLANLKTAVGKLDDGQPFKNPSSSDDPTPAVESVSSTH